MMPGPSGYLIEHDNDPTVRRWFEENASPVHSSIVEFAFRARDGEFDIAAMDPRKVFRQEVQQRSDCQGFACCQTGEAAFTVECGRIIQFSPHFCYRVSQEFDGIRGDNGSSIQGGARLAKEVGFCPLEMCPYPSTYYSNITQEMRDAAAPYKARKFSLVRTYDEVFGWIMAGNGGINWGTRYGFSGSGFVQTRWSPGPGHATCLLAPSERTDSQGRHYVWEWNSGYPVPGAYEVAPDVIQAALDDSYTVAIGWSDLTIPKQKPVDYNPMGG